MTDVIRDMKVRSWANGERSRMGDDTNVRAVVFVHGILSDHRRFYGCQAGLAKRNSDWKFYYVDYEFHDGIAKNGERLRRSLRCAFRDEDRVAIVAHSMGGLVARIACLKEKLPFVRELFLLATPNHGVLRTSSLSIQAQMTLATTGVLWGIRPWRAGMLDLTRVGKVMSQPLSCAGASSDHIGYVTIPGRYFHTQRGVLDHRLNERWKTLFVALDLAFGAAAIVDGLAAVLSVRLQRAHDGIVEESSNNLIPDRGERRSEKRRSIRRVDPNASEVSYAHVVPDSACELCHVAVPDDAKVIQLIGEIVADGDLGKWLTGNRRNHPDVEVERYNPGA